VPSVQTNNAADDFSFPDWRTTRRFDQQTS